MKQLQNMQRRPGLFIEVFFFSSENKEQKIDINIKNFGSGEAFFLFSS